MLTVTVPKNLEKQIRKMAEEVGRTPEDYVRVVLAAGLEELDAVHEAFKSFQRVRSGEERTYTREEMRAELGLDD